MRDFDFLPYERAVEQMAREYAKVRPINPLEEEISKTPDFRDYMRLENTYCYNLEILMLIRQLKAKVTKSELAEHLDALYELKTQITLKEEKVYFSSFGKYPPTPVLSRLAVPSILRRLLFLQTTLIYEIKILEDSYNEFRDIFDQEVQASIVLDSLILLMTNL